MKILIKTVRDGVEGYLMEFKIAKKVDRATAQELVNQSYSMFVEGGGVVEIVGEIVDLK